MRRSVASRKHAVIRRSLSYGPLVKRLEERHPPGDVLGPWAAP